MRKRNWRHTTEDNHSTLSNWQVNVTSWVTRNGVTYNNFSKCKLFIFRKHENTIVRLWKVLQELCMQYLKLAKLKIPDPVKWHNYVLWTYRIIKFQWWRSGLKGTIYTRSDEGRFLLPTQHSIIQWLWVVIATCLGRGAHFCFLVRVAFRIISASLLLFTILWMGRRWNCR